MGYFGLDIDFIKDNALVPTSFVLKIFVLNHHLSIPTINYIMKTLLTLETGQSFYLQNRLELTVKINACID